MAAEVARCRGDRIAGIPYAGLPLAVAASLAGGIPLIYPRREEKALRHQAAHRGHCSSRASAWW